MKKVALRVVLVLVSFAVCGEVCAQRGKQQPPSCLATRIVTVGQEQDIQVSANDKDAVKIGIPYTRGMWETTKPVEVSLVQGKNKLSFTGPSRSMALKDFTLTPIR